MPTRPGPLVASVPVDHFSIISGPRAEAWIGAKRQLDDKRAGHVQFDFTLKTKASTCPFSRELSVVKIVAAEGPVYTFVARFQERIVSGRYDTHKRMGWFNPA